MAEGVSTLTNKQQIPVRNTNLTAPFYFKPKANDRPGEVVADIPIAPSKPAVPEKYNYYIDQNGNRSANRFADWEVAESEIMKRTVTTFRIKLLPLQHRKHLSYGNTYQY